MKSISFSNNYNLEENLERESYETDKYKAILPISVEGKKALACLIKLFQARLTFISATSVMDQTVKRAYWSKISQPQELIGDGKSQAEGKHLEERLD